MKNTLLLCKTHCYYVKHTKKQLARVAFLCYCDIPMRLLHINHFTGHATVNDDVLAVNEIVVG